MRKSSFFSLPSTFPRGLKKLWVSHLRFFRPCIIMNVGYQQKLQQLFILIRSRFFQGENKFVNKTWPTQTRRSLCNYKGEITSNDPNVATRFAFFDPSQSRWHVMTSALGSTTDPGLHAFLGPKVFLIPGGETRRETHPFEAPANGLLPGVNSRCISLQLWYEKNWKNMKNVEHVNFCVLFLDAASLDLMKHFLFWASISPSPNHLFQ